MKAALKRIYSEDFNPLTELEENLFNEIWDTLNEATERGYSEVAPVDYDAEFIEQLRHNNAVFSVFKVHRAQNDMAAQLLDENGDLKPFEQWLNDVKPIADHQVRQWFQTEYDTAVKRAHLAAEWRQFEREADVLPNLEWIKSTSITPGADHQVFWGTVRPINDAFWNSHKPGDRWGCKCSLRATDKEVTPVDIEAVPEIDRTKPARGLDNRPEQDGQMFSDTHPYNPPSCAACTLPGKKVISKEGSFANRLRIFFGAAGKKDCYHCSKPVQLVKTAEAKRRTALLALLEPMLKKNIIRQVESNKAIKIKFNKKGNSHIADDVMCGVKKFPKKDIPKLDDLLREAEFVKSSGLYKERKDNIQRFYYFYDNKRNVYYNVAEAVETHTGGKKKKYQFLYSITADIPK